MTRQRTLISLLAVLSIISISARAQVPPPVPSAVPSPAPPGVEGAVTSQSATPATSIDSSSAEAIINAAAAVTNDAATTGVAEEEAVIQTPGISIPPVPLTTLFFSPTEREAIEQAKLQYAGIAPPEETEADLLDQLQGIKTQKKPEQEFQETHFAQFYLETLMYHTPSDWTAWVKTNAGSKKFTPTTIGASDAGLKVIAINKEDIVLEWTPKNWIQVSNTLKDETPNIRLDYARKVVIFTLRVNQTLTSNDMIIKEGEVVQVVLPNATGTTTVATPGAPGDAPNALPPATSDAISGAPNAPVSAPAPSNPANTGVLGMYKNLETQKP